MKEGRKEAEGGKKERRKEERNEDGKGDQKRR